MELFNINAFYFSCLPSSEFPVFILLYNLQSPRITDTSSAQARKGKDIQGIPWDRLSITREKYRQTRLEQYRNYENVPSSGEKSEKVSIISEVLTITTCEIS